MSAALVQFRHVGHGSYYSYMAAEFRVWENQQLRWLIVKEVDTATTEELHGGGEEFLHHVRISGSDWSP